MQFASSFSIITDQQTRNNTINNWIDKIIEQASSSKEVEEKIVTWVKQAIPNVSQIYSCWMPDISISDYIINYANIVNQGTAYYSPVNDSIIIKNYNNITGLTDISDYVSEISKISKIYDEHYIDIVNEIYDNKSILYRFETNNTSTSNKTLFKSIIVDIPKDGYDGEDYNFNTIGTSDKNLFLISTYSQVVGENENIMITKNLGQ